MTKLGIRSEGLLAAQLKSRFHG